MRKPPQRKAVVEEAKAKPAEAKLVTFGDVYVAWRHVHDRTICGNSVRRYETDYQRFFDGTKILDVPIVTITKSDVEAFIAERVYELKLCQSACNKLYEYTKDTFLYAIEKELIDRDPMFAIKCTSFYAKCTNSVRSKKEQVFSKEKIILLYEQIRKDHDEKPEYIPSYAIELAMLTGLRVGEISALRWTDITDDTISINNSEKYDRKKRNFYIADTKNGVNRKIPVTDDIRDLLERLRKVEMKCGYLSEYVFSNESGRINAPTISSCIRNKCKQVGIEPKGIHNIRKTVNSYLKKNGASSKEASLLMGHTEETNEKYYTYDVFSMDDKRKLLTAGSMFPKKKTGSN